MKVSMEDLKEAIVSFQHLCSLAHWIGAPKRIDDPDDDMVVDCIMETQHLDSATCQSKVDV